MTRNRIGFNKRRISLSNMKLIIPDTYTFKYEETFVNYEIFNLRKMNYIREKMIKWEIDNKFCKSNFVSKNISFGKNENLLSCFRNNLLTVCDSNRLKKLSILTKGKIFPSINERVKEVMKFIITNNLEKQDQLPLLSQKKNIAEDFKDKWFNLPLTVLTEEVKTHCRIVKHRTNLYRDKFVTPQLGPVYPKFSVMGKLIYDPFDYQDRFRNLKQKLISEMLQDSNSKKWLKRKYNKIHEGRRQASRPDKK